jgi:hypothetical protein
MLLVVVCSGPFVDSFFDLRYIGDVDVPDLFYAEVR